MTSIEEDLKSVLKGLLTKKKEAAGDLQKKFHEKLQSLHAQSITSRDSDDQIKKIKPAIKKLVANLKKNQEEFNEFKSKAEQEIEILKQEKEKQVSLLKEAEARILAMEEMANISHSQESARLIEENKGLIEEKIKLQATLAELQEFEGERQKLVEELSAALSQIQELSQTIRENRDENTRLRQERTLRIQSQNQLEKQLLHLKEKIDCNLESEKRLSQQKQDYENRLRQQMDEIVQLRKQLNDSNLPELSYRMKLEEAEKQSREKEEQLLNKSYSRMRIMARRYACLVEADAIKERTLIEQSEKLNQLEEELHKLHIACQNAKLLTEERDAECRKAQLHIAKKIKETTILHDLIERQKIELSELQEHVKAQAQEIEHLRKDIQVRKMHEETLRSIADEKTRTCEELSAEWAEKSITMQKDLDDKVEQLKSLQRVQSDYQQLSNQLQSLLEHLPKNG